MNFSSRLEAALRVAATELWAEKTSEGFWAGYLASSALSTATAVTALALLRRQPGRAGPDGDALIHGGLEWLAGHVNDDGGWGDTTLSLSNLSTTTLCWAAFGAVPGADEKYLRVVQRAEKWLTTKAGSTDAARLAPALASRYGKDRTFSVPILTQCALAGRWGDGPGPWQWIPSLPFELSLLPHQCYAFARLPVVSYALPALIALGIARFERRPPANPLIRAWRRRAIPGSLRLLHALQPRSGGFLEAVPLTSFVLLSLAGSGHAGIPVVDKGADFLRRLARRDGSWPIDSNLATWVTTLATNALAIAAPEFLDAAAAARISGWLLGQQYHTVHPYTHAQPGGWAWTDLPGGVPDADDTAGALLALAHVGGNDRQSLSAAAAGTRWLLDLQNADGGIPTFCRGWTNLPFDRSGADLTAHALRAWSAWESRLEAKLQGRVERAKNRASAFLLGAQAKDGSWQPLWFGNEHRADETNPIYGSSRVVLGFLEAGISGGRFMGESLKRGISWLVAEQSADGSWGQNQERTGTIEETGCALSALAAAARNSASGLEAPVRGALARGTDWLVRQVESGAWKRPAPIGFYFARLWYYERLYPLIFTVEALGRVRRALSPALLEV